MVLSGLETVMYKVGECVAGYLLTEAEPSVTSSLQFITVLDNICVKLTEDVALNFTSTILSATMFIYNVFTPLL